MTDTVKKCGTCHYYAPYGKTRPEEGDCTFIDYNPLPFWVDGSGFVCDWQGLGCDTWEKRDD